MKRFFKYMIIGCLMLTSIQAKALEVRIAAVVNDNIITVGDVENRMRLYMFGTTKQPSQDEIYRLTLQILNELIDENLEIQEAKRFGIVIPDEQLVASIGEIAKRKNQTADDMINALKADGVDIQTLKDKINAEIAWSTLVRKKLYSQIQISDEDINMTIDKLNNNNQTRYLVGEILLLVPDASQDQDVKGKAMELIEQIKKGVPFSAVAAKFSQAPGAATGGDLGWVSEAQIDSKLASTLANMKPGQLSDPIRSEKGWHILLLRDIKQAADEDKTVQKDDTSSRDAIASQIGTQRLNQMAVHYLNDLRASALIEKRMQ